MNEYYHHLDDIPFHNVPIGRLQVLSGSRGTIFWINARAGSEAPEHSHPMEQMTWLTSGVMKMKIGDSSLQLVKPGMIVVIPANVKHQAWYEQECTVVEFTAPPRIDLFPALEANPYGVGDSDDRREWKWPSV